MKKFLFALLLDFFFVFCALSQTLQNSDLLVTPKDIRIERTQGGYNLFIRKKTRLASVMLAETTKDPAGKEDNFAYRAKEYNPTNGDEIRLIDGKILDLESATPFSLVDSTPQDDEEFGRAFLIFVPNEMVYGNETGRHGTVVIGKGTFINIRTFEKRYCDYSNGAAFYDNPYMFDFEMKENFKNEVASASQKNSARENENVVLTDDYNPLAADKFKEISDEMIFSKGPVSILDDVERALETVMPKEVADIVFAVDATGSMKDDIEMLREKLRPRLERQLENFKSARLGLLLYRDYGDNFNTRGLPVKHFDFTNDVNVFMENLSTFVINGKEGGDIPEAVYEALYASMEFFEWRSDAVKKVILIGDAEPHPKPRRTGKYSKALVEKTATQKNISISAIITPDDKARRGRK